jgi:hypothetical protein
MRGDGDRGVLRAGGQKLAAAAGAQRMQRRREPAAIKDEQVEQYAGHNTCGRPDAFGWSALIRRRGIGMSAGLDFVMRAASVFA